MHRRLLLTSMLTLCLFFSGCEKKENNKKEITEDKTQETNLEEGQKRASLDDFFKGKYSKSSGPIKEGTAIETEEETEELEEVQENNKEVAYNVPHEKPEDITKGTGPYFKRNYGMYGYRAVTMAGPVDIDVVNSKGEAVYKSVDGKVVPIESTEIQSAQDGKTGERVDLYGSDAYTVTMKVRDEGKVYLSVVEVYSGTGEPRRINTYDGIDVKPGDYLKLVVPQYTEDDVRNIRNGSSQEYVILKNDIKARTKDDIRGEEVAKNLFTVNIYEGSGDSKTLVDTKVAIKGTALRIKPTQETRNFLGWFVNNNKISEEKEILYEVKGNVDITGIYQN